MSRPDFDTIFKNIYDDSTLDTLRALHSSIVTVMSRNPDFKTIEIKQYERVTVTDTNQSQIRVNVSKGGIAKTFYLKEDFITRVEDSEDIRPHVVTVMNKIKTLFS